MRDFGPQSREGSRFGMSGSVVFDDGSQLGISVVGRPAKIRFLGDGSEGVDAAPILTP